MAPPWAPQDLAHRVRRMHPAAPLMRRSLHRAARASAGDLAARQERRLRLLVRWAASRTAYYRRWFASAGIDPSSIRGLDDLDRLPLLTRADVMSAPEDFAAYPLRTMWQARSSGTSGRPLTVYRTPGSSTWEQAALQRQWSWFGLDRGARRVVLRGSDFATDGGGPVRELPGDHQLLVSSFHLTPEELPGILGSVRAFRPDAVEGWPSSIALLAARMRDAGERLPVRAVITSSETMNPAQQDLMRAVFDGPVVDHYGQTERVVLAGGCEAGGYHAFDDYGITELHPTGVPGRSELVGTALHNWGFPLLRYRTGDEVGDAPAGPCGCGRAFTRLGALDGRSEEAFTASDGRVIPLPGTIVDDLTGLLEAQVAQLAPGRFEVRAVPGRGFDEQALRRTVLSNVERLVGPGQDTTVVVRDRLPRTAAGKLRTAVVEGTAR